MLEFLFVSNCFIWFVIIIAAIKSESYTYTQGKEITSFRRRCNCLETRLEILEKGKYFIKFKDGDPATYTIYCRKVHEAYPEREQEIYVASYYSLNEAKDKLKELIS